MKKIFLFTTAALLLIFVLFALTLLFPVVKTEEGVRFVLKPGRTVKTFVDDLYNQKLIHHPFLFRVYIRLKGDDHSIKAGEYLLKKGSRPYSILNQIASGSGLLYRSFTIIAGWNFRQLRSAVEMDTHLRQTIKPLSDKDVMARITGQTINPEGQFFPDTYYFIEGSPDIIVLKRAYQLMQSKLSTAWQKRDINLPFKNNYEALIAASLIEKEAKLDPERNLIAGVLINRLRKNMLLQFDPTVIYGLGSLYTGKIRKEDLIKDTPYNTYVKRGLPPTPIAFSSLKSILAVMHPTSHRYYYFVAKGDGSHQFSENLAKHNTAVSAIKKVEESHVNQSGVHANVQDAASSKTSITTSLSHEVKQPSNSNTKINDKILQKNDKPINLNDKRKKQHLYPLHLKMRDFNNQVARS